MSEQDRQAAFAFAEHLNTARDSVLDTHKFLYVNEQLYERIDFIWQPIEDHAIESYLTSYMANYGDEAKLIKRNWKQEQIDYIKSSCFLSRDALKEWTNPVAIAFSNGWLDIKAFRETGKLELREWILAEDAENRNPMFFNKIPHSINKEMLAQITQEDWDSDKILFNFAPKHWQFLMDITGTEKLRLQLFKIGYCLYPSNPFKIMFMEVGDRDTAKTTFARVIKKVIGEQNICSVSIQDIANYPFSLVQLNNKMLNLYDDLPDTMIRSVGILKMLSGNSPLQVHRKFKSDLVLDTIPKLLWTTNSLPAVKQLYDDAFFSRFVLTEYTKQFERSDFGDKLVADSQENEREIEGLLLACLFELKAQLGASFENEYGGYAERWKRETNSVYAFVKDSIDAKTLTIGEQLTIVQEELYSMYLDYAEDTEPETKTKVTQELERQFKIVKTKASATDTTGKRPYIYKGIGKLEEQPNNQPGLPQQSLDGEYE